MESEIYDAKESSYFMYPWNFTQHELEELASEVYDEKDQEIENKLYDDNKQDKNDPADEYTITFVNECNTNDESVSKPAI